MHYDPEANILSWQVASGQISHVHEVRNLVIHVSKSGKPLLIEVLDASSLMGQFDKIKNLKKTKPKPSLTSNC